MSLIYLVLYGVIQGLTEFLPISSSAHLALIPKYLPVTDPGVVFDLFMHLGTTLAIIVYFHKDLQKLIVAIFTYLLKRKVTKTQKHHQEWMKNFFFSTLATLVLVFILKGVALEYGRTKFAMGANLIFFGILMFAFDYFKANDFQENKMEKKLSLRESILIGLAQALAIFPGVSRSGVTLTMARGLGLSRYEASKYSFLLSTPIIIIGVVKEVPTWIQKSNTVPLFDALIGVSVSFVVGILTIHYFLKLINKIGLGVFSIYRVVLGILILLF